MSHTITQEEGFISLRLDLEDAPDLRLLMAAVTARKMGLALIGAAEGADAEIADAIERLERLS